MINTIVQKVVEGAKPEQVVLFGSFAAGTQGEDSDIDLLIIKDTSLRRDERDREIRSFLKDVIYPMDIFVYTPNEVNHLKNLPNSFLNKILATGKTIYERR